MKKYLIPLIFLTSCYEVPTANRKVYVYVQTANFSIGEVTVSNRFGTVTNTISSNGSLEVAARRDVENTITITMPVPFTYAIGCDGIPTDIGQSNTTITLKLNCQ